MTRDADINFLCVPGHLCNLKSRCSSFSRPALLSTRNGAAYSTMIPVLQCRYLQATKSPTSATELVGTSGVTSHLLSNGVLNGCAKIFKPRPFPVKICVCTRALQYDQSQPTNFGRHVGVPGCLLWWYAQLLAAVAHQNAILREQLAQRARLLAALHFTHQHGG